MAAGDESASCLETPYRTVEPTGSSTSSFSSSSEESLWPFAGAPDRAVERSLNSRTIRSISPAISGLLTKNSLAFSLPLAEPGLVERVIGSGLPDKAHGRAQLEQVALLADARVEHNVELRLPEGGSDLVLDDLGPYSAAHHLGLLLDRLDAPQVDAHRAIELERASAWGDLRACRRTRLPSPAAGSRTPPPCWSGSLPR